jgi:cysteine desulfurase
MPQPIYLDHNATTPVAADVLSAMLPYLQRQFGNSSSSRAYGVSARERSSPPERKWRRCSGASRTASSSPPAAARPTTSRSRA